MIPRKFKLITAFILLLIFQNLSGQIPAGGAMLNATTGTTYQKIGKGTFTDIVVTGQSFTKGLRLAIGTDVVNAYDSQVRFPAIAGITTNDLVLVAFYARTISSIQETGQGSLNVVIENNTTYVKDLSLRINIGREWKLYFAPVKCVSTLAASQVSYSFHIGFISQTIEIADVKFLNYRTSVTLKDLPETGITYDGQDVNSVWRAPAQERINQIRKGLVDMVVYDEQGQVVKDANVSIEMVRHQFGFGSAIPAKTFLSNTAFRNKVYELFNEVVFENDLKWPQFNSTSMANVASSLDSLDKHKIAVRGHNIIWPSWSHTPSNIQSLATNPAALRMEIEKHIDEVTQFTKGRLNDWDVINEPYTEKDVMAVLGDDVMADWLKRVRQNDRKVKLYLNDYSILSGGGMDTKKQDFYYNLVKYIDEKGGKVDGIGMQGHFGSDLTSISKVYSILERFAGLGKEIKVTEHDINITQRSVQAEYTRDFMTILFSHPSVKSFLFWGFWESSHWRPDAAFFNADWTIRPHGEAFKELVFNQWWTKKTDKTTDSQGKVSFDGFLGTYKYTIKTSGKERSGTFSIINSKQSGIPNTVILSFDQTIPDNIGITSSKPGVLCIGENIILQANTGPGLTYQWFRESEILSEQTANITVNAAGLYSVKIKKGALEIASAPFEVTMNNLPAATITPDNKLSFCPGEKVKLSANISKELTYTWRQGTTKVQGSVTSIDANQTAIYSLTTNAYGCSSREDFVSVLVYSSTGKECSPTGIAENQVSCRVYPNPFKGSFELETSSLKNGPTTVELFNALGSLVYCSELDPQSVRTTFSVSNPGFYTLRLSNNFETKIFKLIGN